jgi:hypothetical protein
VSLEALPASGEGYIYEVLLLEDVLEGGGEGELVVVPLQAELLGHPAAVALRIVYAQ